MLFLAFIFFVNNILIGSVLCFFYRYGGLIRYLLEGFVFRGWNRV